MSLQEFIALLLLALAGWMLWASLRARETAVEASRAACQAEGYLFLDDTVAIESVGATRDDEGQLTIRRVYGFEYSDTGNNRRRASVTVIGRRVVALHLPPRAPPTTPTTSWESSISRSHPRVPR
jgi:hypothetical protein